MFLSCEIAFRAPPPRKPPFRPCPVWLTFPSSHSHTHSRPLTQTILLPLRSPRHSRLSSSATKPQRPHSPFQPLPSSPPCPSPCSPRAPFSSCSWHRAPRHRPDPRPSHLRPHPPAGPPSRPAPRPTRTAACPTLKGLGQFRMPASARRRRGAILAGRLGSGAWGGV